MATSKEDNIDILLARITKNLVNNKALTAKNRKAAKKLLDAALQDGMPETKDVGDEEVETDWEDALRWFNAKVKGPAAKAENLNSYFEKEMAKLAAYTRPIEKATKMPWDAVSGKRGKKVPKGWKRPINQPFLMSTKAQSHYDRFKVMMTGGQYTVFGLHQRPYDPNLFVGPMQLQGEALDEYEREQLQKRVKRIDKKRSQKDQASKYLNRQKANYKWFRNKQFGGGWGIYEELLGTFNYQDAQKVRRALLDDMLLSISNPEELRRQKLKRRWGGTGVEEILAAEDNVARERGKKNSAKMRAKRNWAFNWEMMSDAEREEWNLREEFGNDRWQEVKNKRDREKEERGNFKNRMARHRRNAYTLREFPFLKPLIDAGVIQRNQLPKIAKSLKSVEKIPGAKALMRLAANPYALAAMIASLGIQGLSAQTRAMSQVVGWENTHALTGEPPEQFKRMAAKAGFVDPNKVAEMYYKLLLQFGDPVAAIRAISARTKGLDPITKSFAYNSLGFGKDEAALVDMENGNIEESFARIVAREKEKTNVEWTEKSAKSPWRALWYTILETLGLDNVYAHQKANREWAKTHPEYFAEKMFGYEQGELSDWIGLFGIKPLKVASDAASSDMEYVGSSGNSSQSNSEEINIEVNVGEVNGASETTVKEIGTAIGDRITSQIIKNRARLRAASPGYF